MNPLLRCVRERTQNPSRISIPLEMVGNSQIGVVLVNTVREEGNNFQKRSRIGAKFLKHGGGKRNLDCGGETLLMPCLKYARSTFRPLSRQPVCTPLALMCNGGKKGYRKRVEVELLQDVR
jgi:hypothetical protein